MKAKIHHKFNLMNAGGFSLLELMMALTLFAIFATSYVTSEGTQLADSTMMKKELLLHQLCERKLLEVKFNPPPLEESLTLVPKQGNFSEEGHPDFEYKIEYKRLKIPDYGAITGEEAGASAEGESAAEGNSGESESGENSASTEGAGASANSSDALRKQVFQVMKKNIEELVWQVKVTVNEKGTTFPYELSTLLANPQAKVNMGF